MPKLSRCISAVSASALRNPDSSQYQDFKSALKCVSALVDFTLMAQYRSHTPDPLSYMESYLETFHWTKVIFLEFRTLKATCPQANRQDRELRELMTVLGDTRSLRTSEMGKTRVHYRRRRCVLEGSI